MGTWLCIAKVLVRMTLSKDSIKFDPFVSLCLLLMMAVFCQSLSFQLQSNISCLRQECFLLILSHALIQSEITQENCVCSFPQIPHQPTMRLSIQNTKTIFEAHKPHVLTTFKEYIINSYHTSLGI